MKKISRQSIRSTASTGYPHTPPDDVLLVYRASQSVLYEASLDSIHSPFFIHSVDYSDLIVFSHRRNQMFLLDSSSLLPLIAASSVVLPAGSFVADIWLTLKKLLIFVYGSSPRPPEICLASCSWFIFSAMVCGFLLFLLTVPIDSGLLFVDYIILCAGVAIMVFCPTLERRHAHSEGELMLENYTQTLSWGEANAICVVKDASSLAMVSIDVSFSLLNIDVLVVDSTSFWFTMMSLLDHHVFTIRTHTLVLRECDMAGLFLSSHFCNFSSFSLFAESLIGCLGFLLVSVDGRFIMLDISGSIIGLFASEDAAMVQLLIRLFRLLFSRLVVPILVLCCCTRLRFSLLLISCYVSSFSHHVGWFVLNVIFSHAVLQDRGSLFLMLLPTCPCLRSSDQ